MTIKVIKRRHDPYRLPAVLRFGLLIAKQVELSAIEYTKSQIKHKA